MGRGRLVVVSKSIVSVELTTNTIQKIPREEYPHFVNFYLWTHSQLGGRAIQKEAAQKYRERLKQGGVEEVRSRIREMRATVLRKKNRQMNFFSAFREAAGQPAEEKYDDSKGGDSGDVEPEAEPSGEVGSGLSTTKRFSCPNQREPLPLLLPYLPLPQPRAHLLLLLAPPLLPVSPVLPPPPPLPTRWKSEFCMYVNSLFRSKDVF